VCVDGNGPKRFSVRRKIAIVARLLRGEPRVPNADRIAAIRHRIGNPPAIAELALRMPQQQQTAVRGLVAATKIHCEFLAPDG
jgi:hypothetical protein